MVSGQWSGKNVDRALPTILISRAVLKSSLNLVEDTRPRVSRHRLESLCHLSFHALWVVQRPMRNCLEKFSPGRSSHPLPPAGERAGVRGEKFFINCGWAERPMNECFKEERT